MVEDVSVLIRANVAVEQPEFAILDQAISVFQVGVAGTNRFHLGTAEYDAGLKFFQQEVVVGSDPINSGISLSGGSRVPPRILFRVRLGGMGGLAGHGKTVTGAGH